MLLDQGQKGEKKFGPFLDLCVSSLRRGHANLLCIVPILSDVPEGTMGACRVLVYICFHFTVSLRCGTGARTPSKVKNRCYGQAQTLLIHLLILVGFLWRQTYQAQFFIYFFFNNETYDFFFEFNTKKIRRLYNIISVK